MNSDLKLGAILLVGVIAMSSAAILIRLALKEGASPLVIAAYRLTTATLVMSIPAIRQQAWRNYAKLKGSEVGILVLSGVLLALHFASWVTSLSHTSIISSVVLVTTTPIWTSLAAPLVLGERAPRLTWLGIVVAMIGGSVIGFASWTGTQSPSLWGDTLALAGAILAAGYFLIGRSVRDKIPLVAYLWLVYGVAALLLLGGATISGASLTGYAPRTVMWMVALGLVPQLVGHSAANYALRHLSATFVAISILGEPIGSTLLGAWLLKEWPKPFQVIGGGLILIGIALASLAEEHHRPAQAKEEEHVENHML